MMKVLDVMGRGLRSLLVAVASISCAAGILYAANNYTMTQGSGLTFGALQISTVYYPQMLICDATTPSQCGAVNSGGALSVAGPVTNAGTFAVQATLQASATTAIGKVDPNTIATWGLMSGTAAGTAPTNTMIVGAKYNSSAPSPTNGQTLPLQTDNAGNLLVNIKAGAGSGGTALADGSTFTIGATSETPAACTYVSGGITVTSGNSSVLSCTAAASLHTTVDNSNANGSAVSASSSPVVIASDQAAVAVKAASASFASGAFAAGSFLNATAGDACMFAPKTNLPINTNSTSSVQLIALSGSTTIHICSLSLIAAGATTVAFTTGTGTACASSNAAVIGSTTANIANSISLAANGGLTIGNGQGTIAAGAASSEFCIILGSSVYVAGNLTYVQS